MQKLVETSEFRQQLTLDVEAEGVALPVPHLVAADTGVQPPPIPKGHNQLIILKLKDWNSTII